MINLFLIGCESFTSKKMCTDCELFRNKHLTTCLDYMRENKMKGIYVEYDSPEYKEHLARY